MLLFYLAICIFPHLYLLLDYLRLLFLIQVNLPSMLIMKSLYQSRLFIITFYRFDPLTLKSFSQLYQDQHSIISQLSLNHLFFVHNQQFLSYLINHFKAILIQHHLILFIILANLILIYQSHHPFVSGYNLIDLYHSYINFIQNPNLFTLPPNLLFKPPNF